MNNRSAFHIADKPTTTRPKPSFSKAGGAFLYNEKPPHQGRQKALFLLRIGQVGKLLKAQRFAADVFRKAGAGNPCKGFLARQAEGGGQVVAQRLAAQGKGGVDDAEEARLVPHLHTKAESTLGGGVKQAASTMRATRGCV